MLQPAAVVPGGRDGSLCVMRFSFAPARGRAPPAAWRGPRPSAPAGPTHGPPARSATRATAAATTAGPGPGSWAACCVLNREKYGRTLLPDSSSFRPEDRPLAYDDRPPETHVAECGH
eukprot:gene685-963_t